MNIYPLKRSLSYNEVIVLWGLNPVWCPHKERKRLQTAGALSKEVAVCRPGREASGETRPASVLILDPHSLEPHDNKRLLFKLPGLWHFVMAALQTHAWGLVRNS